MAGKKGQQGPQNIGEASFAVLDAEGTLIAGHNPDMRQDPASTTKMHTLHVLGILDKEGALPKGFWGRYDQTIQRMMVRSDNEAAKTLARAAMGTEDAFVERMNTEAGRMGLSATHFVTVDGWPKPDHYSTARDMAQMAYRFKTDSPELADKYAGIRKNNTAGALAGELDGVKTGTATGYYGSEGRKSIVGFVGEGTISVASATSKEMRDLIMRAALGELKAGRQETLQAHMDSRFQGKDARTSEGEGISTRQYYKTLEETFNALDAAGAGHLKKMAIAVSGVESNFGSPSLFRRERANVDRYIGVYQLGDEHSRYLNQTPEAGQLRALGLMKDTALPGRTPYDPYKNQGVLGAAMLMHYANIATEVTGKEPAELTARDLWTPHLFGQNGGRALMEAAQKNPDMKLKDLTFLYEGRGITAVRRAAYDSNIGPAIKGINSEGIRYDEVTVGQAFDLVQRHFDKSATDFPAHLNAEYRNEFLIAARTEQPHANPDQPERELADLNRINRQQQERIAQAAKRSGVSEPHQQEKNEVAQIPKTSDLTREQVLQVQQVLIAKGFSEGLGNAQADGIMGKRTRDTLDVYNKATQSDLIAQVKDGKAGQLIAEVQAAKARTHYKVIAAPASPNNEGPGANAPEGIPSTSPVPAPSQPQAPIVPSQEQVVANAAPVEKPLDIPALSQEKQDDRRYIANAQRLLGINDQNRQGFLNKHALGTSPSRKDELRALESDVKRIQQALADAGEKLSKFGVDGKVGKETYDALLNYREKHGGQDLPQWSEQRKELAAAEKMGNTPLPPQKPEESEGMGSVPLPPDRPEEIKRADQKMRLPVKDVAENEPPLPTPKDAHAKQHARA